MTQAARLSESARAGSQAITRLRLMRRRAPWWVWTLIGVGGVVVIGVVSLIGFAAVTGRPVTIRNDEPSAVRMSGGCLDDALDLAPGQSGNIDIFPGSAISCEVYVNDGYRYEGCVWFDYSQANAALAIKSVIEYDVSKSSCEKGG